jgi:cysteine dioxygenase
MIQETTCESPREVEPPIDFQSLLHLLESTEENFSLSYLESLLSRSIVSSSDLAPWIRFNGDCYTRNSIVRSPFCELLVLCWASRQASPIHDHRGSACAVKVIEGIATEVQYERSLSGVLYPASTLRVTADMVTGSFGDDIHQVANLEGEDRPLVSLHIYSPPLGEYTVFDVNDTVSRATASHQV